MYELNGDFGEVRLISKPVEKQYSEVPFGFIDGGWHRCNSRYRIERERGQEGHLLLFSQSSGGVLELEGREPVNLPGASVAWIPPGRQHIYYTRKDSIWELYWLHITEDSPVQFERIFNEEETYFLVENMEMIQSEFEKMLHNRCITGKNRLIESSRMISAVYHCLLQEKVKKQRMNRNRDVLVEGIVQAMEAECERPWRLNELSEQYYISVPQLIRRFKNETGMSPHEYLMVLRVQRAEEYLRYTNMTIEEISRKTGFLSTSNFIVQFRKYRNSTPARYRKEMI